MFNRAQLMAANGEIKSFNIDTPKSEETHKSVTMVIEDSVGYYLHYSDIYFVRAILQTKRHLFPSKKNTLCQMFIEFASVAIGEHPGPRIFVLSILLSILYTLRMKRASLLSL